MLNPAPHSELALAAQHDAAGRYHEAIDALARGTQRGDLGCQTQLGKRLLAGDRAPALPAEGARFLHEAAVAGEVEAAARIAAMTALGHGFEHSWEGGLRWLMVAAERGWEPARTQLRVLSRGTPNIDLSSWLTSTPARDLNVEPLVRVLDAFITPAACDWYIARARNRLIRARVYDPVSREDVVRATRSNSVANFGLTDVELLDVVLQAKMSRACGIPLSHMEAPAVLHYGVGEEASEHFDFVNPNSADYAQEIARNGQRVMTFLVYLNEDYEGGETDFPKLRICHKARLGQGLFFVNASTDLQPDLRMLHAGRAPRRGEKWVVSQFIRSRPTRTN
jgi:prolyl 4-hydroxylase